MRPDKVIKDYYKQYQADADKDQRDYEHRLKLATLAKDHVRNYIKEHIDYYKDNFGINLKDYKMEWIVGQYDAREMILNKIMPTYNTVDAGEGKVHLLQLIKYCNTIKAIRVYHNLIHECRNRKEVDYATYRAAVRAYYMKVQECVLEGFAYSFGYGIGEFSINRFKVDSNRRRKVCDFAATNKKKAEIIAAGKIPYDKKMAEICAVRGIKYEGVPYIVYKNDGICYNFSFTGGNITRRYKLKFEHKEYIHANLRNKGCAQIASECKTVKDIYALPCDVRTKMTILLEFDKTHYIRYIRTARQNHRSFTHGPALIIKRRMY